LAFVGKNHHHRTTEKQVPPDQIGYGVEIFFADGLVDRLAAGSGELDETGEEILSRFGAVKTEGAGLGLRAFPLWRVGYPVRKIRKDTGETAER